jgi:hypothetical protein
MALADSDKHAGLLRSERQLVLAAHNNSIFLTLPYLLIAYLIIQISVYQRLML